MNGIYSSFFKTVKTKKPRIFSETGLLKLILIISLDSMLRRYEQAHHLSVI